MLYEHPVVAVELLIPLNGAEEGRGENSCHTLFYIIDKAEQTVPADAGEA
jgi:hypothetical protein